MEKNKIMFTTFTIPIDIEKCVGFKKGIDKQKIPQFDWFFEHDYKVTVAYQIDAVGRLLVGCAFCSRKDMYSRKKGKEVALMNLLTEHDPEDTITIGDNINHLPLTAILKSFVITIGEKKNLSWWPSDMCLSAIY